MKKGRKWLAALVVIMAFCAVLVACSKKVTTPSELPYGDADLSQETAAGLESAAEYRTRFKNGDINVGDVMPYYHDGIYSFFYLAETSNHPVYRVDTTDFIHYENKGEALAPGASTAQDAMIGTGSIVQAGNDYYFFYTGFKKDNPEAIMLAKSSGNVDNFAKVENFMFSAASVDGCDLDGWDFRDPEALYDAENEQFILFVSARRGGEPVIAKFTVSHDLSKVAYGGIIYTDTRFGANVLECSDVFRMGDKWYLTYSVQDTSNGGNDGENSVDAAVGSQGKVFYAMADSIDGPFACVADPALDSHAFYAAKSIQDGTNTYLAGWVRQKNSNIGWQYIWGGNLQVHQLTQNADGTLNVALPQSVRNYYSVERELDKALQVYNGFDMIAESKDYHVVSGEYSSYLLHTTVSFDSEVSEFGFALGVSSNTANIMEVAFVPHANKLRSSMAGQQELCSKQLNLVPGEEYDVTLLAEGSAVTVYVNNSVAFTSRIRNLGNKKMAVYALGGSVTMKDFHLYTPSGYADTLSSGNALTVTESGTAQKGNVNKVHVAPSSPAKVAYTLTQDNYVRYTAAVYADKTVNVTAKLGGEVLDRYTAEANKVLQVSASTYAAKGNTLTLEFTADTATDVWTNVSVETDKKQFGGNVKAQAANNGTVNYTAGEGGVYEYVATLYYGGEIKANPVFEVGNVACAPIADNARLVTLRGAVKLNAGETLFAALGYEKFTSAIGAHNIALRICGGGSSDTFVTGVGTYTKPVAKQCNIIHETVPTFANVELFGAREMSVEMNGNIFGEQGKNGFVYAYGKAGDELKPMTEYNTNGEVWEYKHKAPEANDALEIKADYMKQGGGYVTAVVWVAPADGFIDFVADYESHSENVQVQVLRNRTLLYDGFLKDAGRLDITLTGVEVKGGDCMILAVRAAGRAMGESDGNYHLRIGKGNSSIPFDPTAPFVANYVDDYNTDRQGDYGWKYLDVGYTWENNGEHPTTAVDLQASDFGWGGSGKGIDKNGRIFGDASVAWCNLTQDTLAVSVSGSVSGAGAYIRVWVIRADGGYEKVTDGGVNGTFGLPNKGFVLSPGDMVAVLFFDNNGDGCTLDMQVRSTDDIVIADTALAALVEKAKAIGNDNDRYTEQSFAALATAIANAENFVRDMQETRKTYTEVAEATKALKAAVNGLKLNVAAARADLSAQIEAAAKFNGKELLGDKTAFDEALSAAQTVAAKQDATSDELVAAADALKAAEGKITIKVADFAADFSPTQGHNGWVFYTISPTDWDNYNKEGGTRTELTYADSKYTSGDAVVSVDLWKEHGTAVGYRNYTDSTHTYVLQGSIEYIADGVQACVAYVILRADGTYNHEANWNTYNKSDAHAIKKEFTLGAGDTILLVLRDVDGEATDSKLTLKVGCNDTLTVDTQSLSALIEQAEALDESRYTQESYAVLKSAIDSAKQVIAKNDPTAEEVAQAASALTAAMNGLAFNVAAAKAELDAQIAAAAKFGGKTLIGGREALDTALTAAQTVAAKQDATSEELSAAMTALKAEVDKAVILITDLYEDFAATQGNKGWYFAVADNHDDWNMFAGTTFAEMPYADDKYADGGHSVFRADETMQMVGGLTAVLYRNYTDASHEYRVKITLQHKNAGDEAAVTIGTTKDDGTFALIGGNWRGFGADNAITIDEKVTLGAGDAFALIMRNAGDQATDTVFTMQIGCNDTFTADVGKLSAAIADAKAIENDGYTAASFAALTQAITDAEAVATKENVTAEEIDAAVRALDAAVKGLRYDVADLLATLHEEITRADGKEETDYTAQSWATFSEALATAQSVAGKDNPSPAEVQSAIDGLQAATAGLAYDTTASKAALQTLLDTANGKTESDYTAESYAALAEAVEAAQAVYESADATPAEVRAQITAVQEAIDALKLNNTAAIAELNKQLAAAEKFDGKELLIGGEEFAAALESAKALSSTAQEETGATLQEAAKRLEDAIAAVVVKVADLATEFSAQQGDAGWIYAVADNHGDWDHFVGTTFAEMPYADGKYADGGHTVAKVDNTMQIVGGMTSVLYRNYTDASHEYRVKITLEYIPESGKAVAVIGIKRANGAFELIDDNSWREFTPGNALTLDKNATLSAGDAFAVILRNDGATATDTNLTIQIGCNDTLTVDKSTLLMFIADAESRAAADYPTESYTALRDLVTSAKAIVENANATAGEVYKATAMIRAALAELKINRVVVKADSGWTVYSAFLDWDNTGDKLLTGNMQALTLADGTWSGSFDDGKYGGSVTLENGSLRVTSNGRGIAFVYDVPGTEAYELTFTCDGDRGDGRWYVWNEVKNEYEYNDGWIGKESPKTIVVNGGKRIAIQFEEIGGNINMLFTLTVVPQA